ncbi:Phosphoribosylformylglycinamidine synthase, PurS subunit [hydrothermal vent metagenome]|uniref:Phosphoribosylformylglycinamidine synthase, PurS subunit n=1 Tax=hydrothermal vent metagenome TaxID=652676 RepID=A0A3B0RQZ0_9ZZZZ
MKAIVHVKLKPGVLDPQGQAICGALHGLGYAEVVDVTQGKVIELDLQGSDHVLAKQRVEAMCGQLLANTVIEQFDVEIVD